MKQVFLFIFSALLATSCEDFFSQTVEVDPPAYTPSLVFHQTLSDNADSIRLVLSRSYGILEEVNDEKKWYITGATASWWQAGQKIMDLAPLSQDSGFVYVGKLPSALQSGSDYELRVSHPSYEPVIARQKMPSGITLLSAPIYTPNAGTNEFGEPYSEVEFSFQDKAGEKDYYEFVLSALYAYANFIGFDPNGEPVYDTFYYPAYFEFETTLDPNFKTGVANSSLLADQFFDGEVYKFKGRFVYYSTDPDFLPKIELVVRHTTEEYFYWSKSYYQNYENGGNPFAEPTTVYSNLENGLGIFGLYAERRFDLQ